MDSDALICPFRYFNYMSYCKKESIHTSVAVKQDKRYVNFVKVYL